MKPERLSVDLIRRLEAAAEQRHRAHLDATIPVRPACQRHGWSPAAPRPASDNWAAVGSLCPHCREERRQREAEEAMPETITLDVTLPRAAQRAWDESRRAREKAGHVFGGTTVEAEALRVIDEEREIETALLRETPADRRRTHAEYWGHRHGTRRRGVYVPHPARAGR